MTSIANGPRRRRRILYWLAAICGVLVGGYCLAWWRMANVIETNLGNTITALNRDHQAIACGQRTMSGFPVRFVMRCDTVGLSVPQARLAMSTHGIDASVSVFDPFRADVALIGPGQTTVQGNTHVGLTWASLHAMIPLSNAPSDLAIRTSDLAASVGLGSQAPVPLLRLAKAAAQSAAAGADLDVSATFDGLAFAAGLPALSAVPALSGSFGAVIVDGAADIARDDFSLRGHRIRLRHAALAIPGAAGAEASGKLSVDAQGLVDGKLEIIVRDPRGLSRALAKALPQAASQIAMIFGAIASLGENPVLPVHIRRSKVSVGFFTVGRIPTIAP